MPCLLLIFVYFFPRIALFFMWLLGYGGRAFDTVLFPLLGFFFMPYTTCAYAIGMNEAGGFKGWSFVVLMVAIILDLGQYGSGYRYGTRA